MWVEFEVKAQQGMDFFTEGSNIIDSWTRRDGLKFKQHNYGFVHYKDTLFTSQDVNWWTGIMWIIVLFLSAV